jgi:hypothetical protein
MTEATFNWRMMKHICTELHIYDEEANYKPFDSVQVTSIESVQWQCFVCCRRSTLSILTVKPAVCCLSAHLRRTRVPAAASCCRFAGLWPASC